MHIATKLLRSQLMLIRPLITQETIEMSRLTQDRAGALIKRRLLVFDRVAINDFEASFAQPREIVADTVILYLHGGGYISGRLKYAEGFGSILAARTGLRTFCVAYRLAPEHPHPAALEDAAAAYQYLLDNGVEPGKIILAGESAGGGLCFALCLYLKDQGRELPAGIIAISPWTDLTLSGASIIANKEGDPLLTEQQLHFFADSYTVGQDVKNPYISPVFGDLRGLPDTLIFAGGDELLLSDSQLMQERLLAQGVDSTLYIRAEMWHGYILYGVEESREDFQFINNFISRYIGEGISPAPEE